MIRLNLSRRQRPDPAPSNEPQMEWITKRIPESETSESVLRHYLVTLSGEVIGDVDEYYRDAVTYCADHYAGGRTWWINLETAKAKLELMYAESQRLERKDRG